MPASGMKHHRKVSVIIFLKLDKMISSSQRPYLKISRLQLAQKLGILFITVHFLKRDI